MVELGRAEAEQSLAQAIALLTCRPAALLGAEAGRLVKGEPADLCLFHPERIWQVEAGKLPGKAQNTPFDGRALEGVVLGTWKGGLVRFNQGKLRTFSTADGLISDRINSIGEDRDGVLWVATSPGLQTMRNGRFKPVQNEIFRTREDVRTIHLDREGTLWFGTSEGLVRYQKGRWSVIRAKDGLASDD